MKKELFAELVESIEEAGKIRKGLVKPSRTFRYRPVDIKRIHKAHHVVGAPGSLPVVELLSCHKLEVSTAPPQCHPLSHLLSGEENPI